MNNQTLTNPKKNNSTSFLPVLAKRLIKRDILQESVNDAHNVSNMAISHKFSNVQVGNLSFTSGVQANRIGGQSNNKYEQEADKIASHIVDERFPLPQSILKERTGLPIQRQETKEATNDEKYKEAAKKAGEAFLETPIGKRITDKAKKLGENFIATLAGKIITGAVAAGAVSAIVAKNAELPIQVPEIPLDKITPGLSVKITYKGPVQNPTDASIAFIYRFGREKESSKKSIITSFKVYSSGS